MQTLEGVDSNGLFATSKAKGYPPRLCLSIAQAFKAFVDRHTYAGYRSIEDLTVTGIDICADLRIPLDPYLDVAIGADYSGFNG